MVANAVRARVPTRVYTVQLGGFDTHANERETQQRLHDRQRDELGRRREPFGEIQDVGDIRGAE